MKLWRKLGNKIVVKDQEGNDIRLTGRQVKHQHQLLNSGKSEGSKLLISLIKRI